VRQWARPLAGAAASAALLSVAGRVQAPWHWLMLVALSPWLFSLEGAGYAQAVGSGVLLAVGFTAGAFYPVAGALSAYSGAPGWAAWAVLLLLGPLFLQPQFLVAAAARVFSRGRFLAITALAYAGAEWALPKLFSDTIGYALYPSAALRQWAEIAGGRGLTLLCFAVSECVVLAARGRTRALAVAFALVALALGLGELRLRQIEAKTRAAPVFAAGVVQADITAYDKLAAEQGTFETVRQILDAHDSLSRGLLAQGPLDLLVWPETVYPTTFGSPKSVEGAEFDRQISALAAQVPLVFGAFQESAAGEHNAAFFLERSGRWDAYRKTLLFPLTEHVPGWLDWPPLRSALPWTGHWQPGPGPRVMPVRLRDGSAIGVAPLICYEALDAGYVARAARAGAEVLLTLSNDAWWPGERMPRLHLVLAAFRSVETRLPQIRATNSGISALVLPSGALVSATQFGTRAALRLEVPRVGRPWTPAAAFGDWLGPAALIGCATLLFAARRRR
jgi:apolipoprotein N-acyltransferase